MTVRRTTAGRTVVYSIVGFCAEVAFSAAHDSMRGRRITFRTSPWMLPIYALIRPLYEPLHDALRSRPPLHRAIAYGTGFLAVEYTSGRILRAATGEAPWDYSEARVNLHGLIRPDYFVFWAAAGLALEPLHDGLTGR